MDMSEPLLTDDKGKSENAEVDRQSDSDQYKPPAFSDSVAVRCNEDPVREVTCVKKDKGAAASIPDPKTWDNCLESATKPEFDNVNRLGLKDTETQLFSYISLPSLPAPSLPLPLPPEIKTAELGTGLRDEVKLLDNQGATM